MKSMLIMQLYILDFSTGNSTFQVQNRPSNCKHIHFFPLQLVKLISIEKVSQYNIVKMNYIYSTIILKFELLRCKLVHRNSFLLIRKIMLKSIGIPFLRVPNEFHIQSRPPTNTINKTLKERRSNHILSKSIL